MSVLDTGDAGDDLDIAGHRPLHEVKGVLRLPDVRAGSLDGEHTVRVRRAARQSDGADVLDVHGEGRVRAAAVNVSTTLVGASPSSVEPPGT